MTSEQDTRRSIVIVDGDIPATDAAAPKVAAGDPQPITLQAMARLLHEMTVNPDNSRPNNYPIPAGDETFRTHDDDGFPASVVSPVAARGPSFAPLELISTLAEAAGATFDNETLGRIHDPRVNTDSLLRDITGVTRHDGRGAQVVDGSQVQTDIQKRVSGVLQRNRFNPTPGTSPFSSGQAQSNIDQRPIGVAQTSFGVYDPTAATAATGITYQQMKKLGLALMLRSTGQFIGGDSDPTSTGIQAGALIPGAVQLAATRIDRKKMWATDLTSDQGRPPGISDRTSNVSSDLILDGPSELLNGSYGSLNTFIEPFGNLAPVGMVALAAALVIAVKLLATAVSVALTALSPPAVASGDSAAPTAAGTPRVPGTSKLEVSSTSAVTNYVFGILQTQHPYSAAFSRGVDVFFEFNGTDFLRVLTAPGYYAVLVRSIIRSGNTISRSIADVFSNGGAVAGIQAVLGLADVIRTSKIIAFSNLVAGLGDRVLALEDDGFLTSLTVGTQAEPGNLPNRGKVSTIDRLDADNPATHNMKSRVKETSLKLAWRTSSTPSAYLLPKAVIEGSFILTSGPSDIAFADRPTGIVTAKDAAGSRFDASVVKKIEDQLDSEYVPFYFHDLRTNEIVSFHAFLSTINETFNANYDSSNYYGRVDPVRIYSHTERTINLAFHIVATSHDDFDTMWWKVNRLVMMLYPQWSKGRQLKPGADVFIQPFSQVPTSSPVIRLRLGDLFRSNYSKFALARLFGLGEDDFTVNGITPNNDVKDTVPYADAVAQTTQRMLKIPTTNGELNVLGYRRGERAFLVPFHAPLQTAPNLAPPDGRSIVRTPIKQSTTPLQVDIDDVALKHLNSDLVTATYKVFVRRNSTDGVAQIDDSTSTGPYLVASDSLVPDVSQVAAIALAAINATSVALGIDVNAVDDFLSAGNNSIVRSFQSVAGRGLAGVITTMGFDWKAPTWDTTDIGRRAPQWCQVTMTFQPIHDIAPGLDVNGFDRAPIYNVGAEANKVGQDPYGDDANARIFASNHRNVARNRKKRG